MLTVQEEGLGKGLVVLIDHLYHDVAEVVGEFVGFGEVEMVDFEPFAVHVLANDFDSLGIALGLIGRVTRDGGAARQGTCGDDRRED